MTFLPYLLARFSEPSSYAGLGALLALLGWNLSDTLLGQLAQLLAAGCGLLALCLKERGLVRAIVLVFAALPALSACGGLAGTESAIATGCGEFAKAKIVADGVLASGFVPQDAAAKVASIESFAAAACAEPPTDDPVGTAIWLGRLVGEIAALTAIAP